MGENKRLDWLDVLRCLGMFLVVCGHVTTDETPDTLRFYIYAFHMPLFFMLSGVGLYLQLGKRAYTVKEFVWGKVRALLWPYLTLNLILIPLWMLNHVVLRDSKQTVPGLLVTMIYSNQEWRSMPSSTTWFLTTLFLTLMLFYGILRICRGQERWILALCCGIGILGYDVSKTFINRFDFPWHANTVPVACFFVMLGYFFMSHYDLVERFLGESKARWAGILAACVVVCLVCARFNVKISMSSNFYGYLSLFLGSSVCGSFACYILAKFLPPLDIFRLVGRNTIIYLALHEQIYKLYRNTPVILGPMMEKVPYLMALLTFILLIPVAKFTERYCSILISGRRRKRDH